MKSIHSNKQENKSTLKKRKIIKVAASVFSEKGYINTSIKNITDEASVAVGTFYTYFNNKEEVLEQIYEEISDLSLKVASNASFGKNDSTIKKFTLGLSSAIYVYIKNADFAKILLIKCIGINECLENKRIEILDKTNIYLKRILEHLQKVHNCEINNLDVTSVIISQSIFGVITCYLDGKFKGDVEEVIFSLCTYHLKALNIEFTKDEVKEYIRQAQELYCEE